MQARVEESVCVDVEESSRWVFPDVKVVEHSDTTLSPAIAVADVVVAEPVIIPLLNEQPTQRHIEIVDANSGNRLVTAIELLSPTNKEEPGRNAYRRKQRDYIEAGVNLVEIDLIRSGGFIVAAPLEHIPPAMRTPYMVCIRRATRRDQAEIIPIPMNHAVPNFRIPLRATDQDIVLQLQSLLDDCYRRGRYASIDYTQPPKPKLDERANQWAEAILKNRERS